MDQRVIRVQGRGSATQSPDHVAISFLLRSTHPEYGEALAVLDRKAQVLRERLKEAQVSHEKLKTTNYYVDPKFVTKGKQEVFAEYEARHTMRLEIPWTKEHLNLVLDKLSAMSEGLEFSISFFVQNSEELRRKALELAVGQAKKNAETIADAAGVALGDIVHIDYGWTEVRFTSEMNMTLAECQASPDINPADVEQGESVTMTWAIHE